MEGGRSLCYTALYGFAVQAAVFWRLYPKAAPAVHDRRILWLNGIYGIIMLFILLWNGILRIFFTSVRLRLKYRILMLLAMWIPGLNLAVLLYAMRIVHGEYDFACYKESVRQVRAQSQICSTRYPLLLVHGVGFRDLRFLTTGDGFQGSWPGMGRISTMATRRLLQRLRSMQMISAERYRTYAGRQDVRR